VQVKFFSRQNFLLNFGKGNFGGKKIYFAKKFIPEFPINKKIKSKKSPIKQINFSIFPEFSILNRSESKRQIIIKLNIFFHRIIKRIFCH
jgi:hypothetical protein